MREFEGRVAVVTGAASGIGRAMAGVFAREGMKVVLADVDEPALEAAVAELTTEERDVIGVRTDVSSAEDVDALAERTLDAYGGVHILCNNAGVAGDLDYFGKRGERLWEHSLRDWEWTFGVNMWGVVHGLRTFVPIMIEQGDEGHIVNTASMAGLLSGARADIYGATKHAVVRITEALYYQLGQSQSRLKASVLCPGIINTRILSSARNRPEHLQNEGGLPSGEELERQAREADEAWHSPTGLPPEEVAEQVLQAIRDEQLYILTRDVPLDRIRERTEQIVEMRNPPIEARPPTS